MAFRKEKVTEYGITAEYWKVTAITTDKESKRGSFIVSLYKDEESSHNSAKSFEGRYVNAFMDLPFDITEEERSNIADERYEKYFALGNEYTDQYEACYHMAKELDPYFADAEDC